MDFSRSQNELLVNLWRFTGSRRPSRRGASIRVIHSQTIIVRFFLNTPLLFLNQLSDIISTHLLAQIVLQTCHAFLLVVGHRPLGRLEHWWWWFDEDGGVVALLFAEDKRD